MHAANWSRIAQFLKQLEFEVEHLAIVRAAVIGTRSREDARPRVISSLRLTFRLLCRICIIAWPLCRGSFLWRWGLSLGG